MQLIDAVRAPLCASVASHHSILLQLHLLSVLLHMLK
jgi:hypothetical protein